MPRDDQRSRRRSLVADVRLAGSRALAWAPQRRADPDALPARRAAAASPAQSVEAQSSGSGAMPRGAAYWPPSERMPAKKKMSSLGSLKKSYKKCSSLQSGMLSRSASSDVAVLAISSHSKAARATDPLALAPHESRPPLGAPQMPPVFRRIAPAAAPAQLQRMLVLLYGVPYLQ